MKACWNYSAEDKGYFPVERQWSKDNFVKHGYFYIDPNSGNGDLIYNTCRMIVETRDNSPWALDALDVCRWCLTYRIRWPNKISRLITSTTHTQEDITRDPYIAYHTALFVFHDLNPVFGEPEDYDFIMPPWYLWRPNVWGWIRYLKKGGRWHYFWYRTGTWIKPRKQYVKDLDRLMELAIQLKGK